MTNILGRIRNPDYKGFKSVTINLLDPDRLDKNSPESENAIIFKLPTFNSDKGFKK